MIPSEIIKSPLFSQLLLYFIKTFTFWIGLIIIDTEFNEYNIYKRRNCKMFKVVDPRKLDLRKNNG